MSQRPATSRQLRYLKNLAEQTGQTFTYPKTAIAASREIARLKGAATEPWADRRRERKQIADQIAVGPVNDATRVTDREISGHGSTATWAQNRPQDPPPVVEDPPAARRPTAKVGKRTELARYQIPGAERVVYGQRVDGVVRVTDRPAARGGRAYLIERGLDSNAELEAVVADYVAQAEKLREVPMSVSPLQAELEARAAA